MWILIIKHLVSRVVRYFRTHRSAKLITAFLFGAVFCGIGFGVYLFFREGFSYIGRDSYFGRALLYYLYEMYFVLFMTLVVLNAVITGLFGLYKNGNNSWIMSSPRYGLLPQYVYIRTCLNSLWPFFVIVIPFLISIKYSGGLSTWHLLGMFLASIVLTIMIVSLVFIVINLAGMAAGYVDSRFSGSFLSFKRLAAIVVLIISVFLFFIWRYSIDLDLVKILGAENLVQREADISAVSRHFAVLPTHLLASIIWHSQFEPGSALAIDYIVLSVLAGLAIAIWWRLAGRLLPLWQQLQAGHSPPSGSAQRGYAGPKRRLRFRGIGERALLKKEAVVTLRNSRGLFWFGFLFSIWLLQTAINTALSKNIDRYALELIDLPVLVQVLEFMTAAYFIAAFVLRFAFPSFSAERKSVWVIACAPIDMKKVYRAKLVFYCLAFLVLGLSVSYINLAVLDLSLKATVWFAALLATTIVFITVLGVSLGAIFPNFDTDDPSSLSTSLPGLGFILFALVYSALGGAVYYLSMAGSFSFLIAVFLVISLAIIWWLLRFAPRALNRLDFVKTVH